ncbi:MAG: site-specific integrase [Prevotellaceae bacterium]|jgi:integrase|nr:site-specific integrase [Prevotellaceae bacterium]
MGNKKQIKVKEPIKLRFKKLSNGNKSIYLDYYRDGKREYEFLKLYLVLENSTGDKSANVETLRLANAIKAQKIVELQNTEHGFSVSIVRSKVGLLEYVKHFAEQKREKTDGNERGTYSLYVMLCNHLEQYSGANTKFKHIDKSYCMGFIDYLRTTKNKNTCKLLHENTQLTYLKKFEAVINNAITDEIISLNPLKQIKRENKPQRKKANVEYLTIDEVNKLINTPYKTNQYIKSAFLFSCFSGLRFSDIRALTWDKLQKDSTGGTLIKHTQKKTQEPDYLPVSNRAIQHLPDKGTANDSDNVFKLPSCGYVNMQLREWSRLAGINKRVTFHVARHTAATLLLSLGVPIETVSKILGHSDIQTTQIYAKVMDKNKRAAVDKLDGLTD